MSLFKNAKLPLAGLLMVSLTGCESLPEGVQNNLGNITGVVAGLGAYAICQNNSDNETLCAAAALAVGAAGKLLGDEIAKNLSEKEQRMALEEASIAVASGEPRTFQLPDSGGSLTIEPSGDTVTKTVQASVLADTEYVGTLNGVYEVSTPKTRGSASDVSVYAQPDQNSAVVQSVASNENLHVFGSPEGSDWLLVGLRAQDDLIDQPAPVAIGFVPSKSLPNSSDSNDPNTLKSTPENVLPASATLVELSWVTQCDPSTSFQLTKADGTEATETSETCIGPAFETISG